VPGKHGRGQAGPSLLLHARRRHVAGKLKRTPSNGIGAPLRHYEVDENRFLKNIGAKTRKVFFKRKIKKKKGKEPRAPTIGMNIATANEGTEWPFCHASPLPT
jgi:hypothetical protein